jgi:hypothetical protein
MAASFDGLHLQEKLLAPKESGGAKEQRLRLKKEKEHTRVRTKDCNRNLLWGEHADAQLFPVSSGSPRRTPEQGSRKQANAMSEQIEISKYAYGAPPQLDAVASVTRWPHSKISSDLVRRRLRQAKANYFRQRTWQILRQHFRQYHSAMYSSQTEHSSSPIFLISFTRSSVQRWSIFWKIFFFFWKRIFFKGPKKKSGQGLRLGAMLPQIVFSYIGFVFSSRFID